MVVKELSDETHLLQTMGFTVQRFRKQAKLSQKQLAERVGKSVVTVSMLERGQMNPSLLTLQAVAQALGTDLPLLLSTPDCVCISQGQLIKKFYPPFLCPTSKRKEK